MSAKVVQFLALGLLLGGLGWGGLKLAESFAERRLLREEISKTGARAAQLEEELNRLRERVEIERLRPIFNEVEAQVTELRGLEFLEPVDYRLVHRAEIPELFRGIIREFYSEEELVLYGLALARVGLLPEGLDLEETYIALLGEQVAAFYDQFRHRLYLLREAPLELAQNRIILAHELVHALQDQHFKLKRLPLALKDNDDQVLAASALVEGDATLVMSMISSSSLTTAEQIGQYLGSVLTTPVRRLIRAPRYLRESLLFPYLSGQDFVATLFYEDGFQAINAAYENLPQSSAEIEDPSLYGRLEIRTRWPMPETRAEQAVVQNTLGSFGLGVWLELHSGPGTRAGLATEWRGDRLFFFPSEEDDAMVWMLQFANAEAARRRAEQMQRGLRKRYKPLETNLEQGTFRFATPRALSLHQRGQTLVLIDAGDVETRQALEEVLERFPLARHGVDPPSAICFTP